MTQAKRTPARGPEGPWIANRGRVIATPAWAQKAKPAEGDALATDEYLTPQLAMSAVIAAGYNVRKRGGAAHYEVRALTAKGEWRVLDENGLEALGAAVAASVVLVVRGNRLRLDSLAPRSIAVRARRYIDLETN